MKQVSALILILAIAATVSAQLVDQANLNALAQANSLGIKPAASPISLLDLSKMRWYHSYSLSFMSGSGHSSSYGLLNSMMIYELSSSLTLGFNLALAHDIAGSSWFGDQRGSVYPGFWIDYRPSDKFQMSVSVQRSPGSYVYHPNAVYPWPRFWSPY